MEEKLLSQFEAVASGLAHEGIAVIEDFLNSGEVLSLVNESELRHSLSHFRKAGIGKLEGKRINESIRGDYIEWIDRSNASPAVQVYLERISQLIAFLNKALFLSLKDYEVHQTIYPVGSFYKRHLDQFKRDDRRKLSIICYLNENWKESEGGQLRVYFPEGSKDFFPISGRLVCFRSDLLEHEVLPANRERLSITGWMLDAGVS